MFKYVYNNPVQLVEEAQLASIQPTNVVREQAAELDQLFLVMTQFESFHLVDRLNIIRERKQCNEGVDLSKIYVEPRFIDSVHLNQMHDNCVAPMTFAACLTVPRIYDLD